YEEAAGILSKPTIVSGFEKKRDFIKYSITNRLGLFDGENDLIIENRCVLNAQVPGFTNVKAKNYEVVDNFSKLSNDDKSFFINFFNVPQNIPIKYGSTLILGQQLYHEGKYLSEANSVLSYQLLLDYYCQIDN